MVERTIRFKIDENLPVEVAEALRAAGHDAVTAFDQGLVGSDDARLASICRTDARALVTCDLDFADIRSYPPSNFAGIVVFRLARSNKRRILRVLARVLPKLETEPIAGTLWIVEEDSIRIRTPGI